MVRNNHTIISKYTKLPSEKNINCTAKPVIATEEGINDQKWQNHYFDNSKVPTETNYTKTRQTYSSKREKMNKWSEKATPLIWEFQAFKQNHWLNKNQTCESHETRNE